MNVVCVGDCGVDRYPDRDRPGGITLNFAAHARRLFSPDDRVIVVSALGTDDVAGVVTAALDELPIEALIVGLPGTTSIQHIDIEPNGEKIFVRYDQGVLGDYRVGEREQNLIAEADLLMAPHYRQIDGFFDSIMRSPSRGLRAVDFADIGENPVTTNIEKYLDHFDIAFMGLSPDHGDLDDLIGELESLAARTDKLFVITLGPNGSQALSRNGKLTCPAVPVPNILDTTGAGDTFAAAFLHEYCASKDVSLSLKAGATEAAKTIQHLGAFLPSRTTEG